jgi:exosortase D (VPLPA-CTERM-specific)
MTQQTVREVLEVPRSVYSVAGPTWLLIAVVAAIPIFWFGFAGLAKNWVLPEFRLKAFVPLFSLLLFLQVLRSVPPRQVSDRTEWLGVGLLMLALSVAIAGNQIKIDDLVFGPIVPWVAALIVVVFGLGRGVAFWAPIASLSLMLPLPQFVVAPLHGFLASLSTGMGTGLLRLVGVPVRLEGQIIDFGVFQIRVAEATSGVVNLLPLLLVFFFFSCFFRGPLWSRVLPLLLVVPALVLLNAGRIAAMGLSIRHGDVAAVDRIVDFSGEWVLFAICVLLIMSIVVACERLAGHCGSLLQRFDVDLSAAVGQVRRISNLRSTRPLIAAASLSVLLCAVFELVSFRPSVQIERASFQLFPPEIDGWSGSKSEIDPSTARVLNADDYVLIDYYRHDQQAGVNFWSAFYNVQEPDKMAIHSPEICLPGDGWNILSLDRVELPLKFRGERLPVNRAVIHRGSEQALVYYWFEGRGRTMANERAARLLTKLDDLILGRSDGALVRFTTPILPQESEQQADDRIMRLLEPTLAHLPRFIPD